MLELSRNCGRSSRKASRPYVLGACSTSWRIPSAAQPPPGDVLAKPHRGSRCL